MEMVTVATFSSYAEALVARASLEANGVECFMPNENMLRIRGGLVPFLSMMDSGAELQVAESDVDKAREFLGR